MQLRRLTKALLIPGLLTIACSDSNEPDTYDAFYVLSEVNGENPPEPVEEIEDCTVSIVEGRLDLTDEGDFDLSLRIGFDCTEQEDSESELAVDGSYSVDGDQLTFVVQPGVSFGATRDGNRLSGTIPAGTGVLTEAVAVVFRRGEL